MKERIGQRAHGSSSVQRCLLWSTGEEVVEETTEETVPSCFSGISKKQFTDFSWRSDVRENWRTIGQSTAFHAAPRLRVQKNSFARLFLHSPLSSSLTQHPRKRPLRSQFRENWAKLLDKLYRKLKISIDRTNLWKIQILHKQYLQTYSFPILSNPLSNPLKLLY